MTSFVGLPADQVGLEDRISEYFTSSTVANRDQSQRRIQPSAASVSDQPCKPPFDCPLRGGEEPGPPWRDRKSRVLSASSGGGLKPVVEESSGMAESLRSTMQRQQGRERFEGGSETSVAVFGLGCFYVAGQACMLVRCAMRRWVCMPAKRS